MPGTGGVPGDAVTLRAENARLRMLLEDKDAQIAALKTQNAGLAERVAVGAADLPQQRELVGAGPHRIDCSREYTSSTDLPGS
jgi:hypothetical protein